MLKASTIKVLRKFVEQGKQAGRYEPATPEQRRDAEKALEALDQFVDAAIVLEANWDDVLLEGIPDKLRSHPVSRPFAAVVSDFRSWYQTTKDLLR
jgi:hypothetical protein